MNLASSKRQWPLGRGFERFYGFLGGETNQWYPDLVYDNHPVAPAERRPRRATTSRSTSPTRRSSSSRTRRRSRRTSRSSSTTAPAPRTRRTTCRRSGPTSTRASSTWATRPTASSCSSARRSSGSSPSDAELSPINPYADTTSHDGKPWSQLDVVRPWDSLSRRREAAVLPDGRGLRRLPQPRRPRARAAARLPRGQSASSTTRSIVLVSDNGASGEGGPNGSVNENKFFNGLPDTIEENLKYLDELGSPKTYNHYPTGWAWAFNTPFKMWKRYASYEGGTADPLIVSWPAGIEAAGRDPPPVHPRDRHRADAATSASASSCRTSSTATRSTRSRASASRRASHDADARRRRRRSSTRCSAPARSGTRAGRPRPRSPAAPESWGDFAPAALGAVRHRRPIRASATTSRPSNPEKLQELIALWWAEAGKYQALPLESRGAIEILARRAAAALEAAHRYVYYPGGAEVPESVAPNIRNRSYTIAAEVEIDDRRGGRRALLAGLALRRPRALRQGRQAQVRLQLGRRARPDRSSPTRADPDRARRALGLVREGGRRRCRPRARSASTSATSRSARAKIKTQPGKFGLGGGGLDVGRSGAEPVTDDYPGRRAVGRSSAARSSGS